MRIAPVTSSASGRAAKRRPRVHDRHAAMVAAALLHIGCSRAPPSSPPARVSTRVAPSVPATPVPAAPLVAPPVAATRVDEPATFTERLARLAEAAVALSSERPIDSPWLCAGYERPDVTQFADLPRGPTTEVLAMTFRATFSAPAPAGRPCRRAPCETRASAWGVVLPGAALGWAGTAPQRVGERFENGDPTPLDGPADAIAPHLAPLREALDGLRSTRCAPARRFEEADLRAAYATAPDVLDLLRRHLLGDVGARALPPRFCRVVRAEAGPWTVSLAGLRVFARSGESTFQVDALLGERDGRRCVRSVMVLLPE